MVLDPSKITFEIQDPPTQGTKVPGENFSLLARKGCFLRRECTLTVLDLNKNHP